MDENGLEERNDVQRPQNLFCDLEGNALLHIEPGERLYRIYLLKSPRRGEGYSEHRILTKETRDGSLELVSFAFVIASGAETPTSYTARACDVPPKNLDHLIERILSDASIEPDDIHVIDLSHLTSLDKQLQFLQQQGNLEI